ncbi:hypothetical protein MBRA_06333 [Methylobacterium brachiatum]|nr:hypothetical protein MBRA_06333 [Methylobacterium brachiatum]
MRRPVGRRSRGSATTGPGTKAGDRAGSRAHHSTSTGQSRDKLGPADPLKDAQVLVGTAVWLASLRDWFVGELNLAKGETVHLRRVDIEVVRTGLTRCLACLDMVGVDPAQLPPLDDASSEAATAPATPSPRVLQ